jgi:hypothetical protein
MRRESAIAAVAYELARRNGESPMDRGAALGSRVLELSYGGLADGFERLARERGYRWDVCGVECVARVQALAPASLELTELAA